MKSFLLVRSQSHTSTDSRRSLSLSFRLLLKKAEKEGSSQGEHGQIYLRSVQPKSKNIEVFQGFYVLCFVHYLFAVAEKKFIETKITHAHPLILEKMCK